MISDATALMTSAFLLLGYYFYALIRLRKDSYSSMPSMNTLVRQTWVENIMKGGPGKDILAVQTLRNSTMAATFFASTAILLVIAVLNLLTRTSDNPDVIFETLYRNAVNGNIATLKLLLLLVEFWATFFCFALAVRMYNHVGFLINSQCQLITPELVAELLNRGGQYYSLGMHAYYLALPVLFWVFGAIYLLIATIGVIALLYHADFGVLHGHSFK